MFRTLSPGDSISVALRKLLQGVRRVKSGYRKICNKGSRHSEYQRSGIKLRDLAFCVWEGASLWARWICMHLSYLGRIAFPCSPCFLRSSSSSAITVMGWQHLQDHSLGSPRSHLEARSCWWLWHFLFINMAGGIFISQEVLLCLVFFCLFVCFKKSYAALHISCSFALFQQRGKEDSFSSEPSVGLSFNRSF